jgi:predicted short-subunit dehydrogenase-like oxidoreductase (DUF2520 family)
MKVVIIGSGNVATVLGKKIAKAGHEILQVISRSVEHADHLAGQLNSIASDDLKNINPGADIFLICVGDNSIKEIAQKISSLNKIIAHTAGGISKNVLQSSGAYGVLYPLQTLRKEMEYLPEIPVLVDGSSDEVSKILFDFASTWASSVSRATDAERAKLHVAAVFASNFTNHLYALTEDFCRKEGIEFSNLLPLIKETATRLGSTPAANLQTGPASRNDTVTIKMHLDVLAAYPELKDLYKLLSDSIIKHSFQV